MQGDASSYKSNATAWAQNANRTLTLLKTDLKNAFQELASQTGESKSDKTNNIVKSLASLSNDVSKMQSDIELTNRNTCMHACMYVYIYM